ncbi:MULTISPECIES: hypothetical protein [Alcanivorax]|uniref:hypothetical protein n=1 Tax=Alcanivorax TaxID=59753 RepID=UPI0023538B6B|nr:MULTISPECIES: hypothetical protein [Alcanivorax]MDF1636449.1 hypothetical protein [Alcanivorax jadensis]
MISTRGFNGFDLDSVKIGPVRNQDICLMAMIEQWLENLPTIVHKPRGYGDFE